MSADDGATWVTSTLMFTGGTHPDISRDPLTGAILRAARVSGAILANIQYPGDASPSSNFNFKGTSGANIPCDNDGFHVTWETDGSARAMLIMSSGGAIKNYYSTDMGRTWAEIT